VQHNFRAYWRLLLLLLLVLVLDGIAEGVEIRQKGAMGERA